MSTAWELIPLEDRHDVYSESIKHDDRLWIKPTYKKGEVWGFYGDIGNQSYKVIKKYEKTNQLLCSDTKWGRLHVFDLDRYGYAESGTPSMRLRYK